MKLILVSALLGLVARVALAFPVGAGSCPKGEDAVGGTHLADSASKFRTGSLAEGGIEVAINGVALDPERPFNIMAGTLHTWSISVAEDAPKPFKGFLVRLEGDNLDAREAFIPGPNKDVQEAIVCTVNDAVGGVTHTDRNPKRFVSGELILDDPSDEISLDVTVVVENLEVEDERRSAYFYSGFTLNSIVLSSGLEDSEATVMPSEGGTMDGSYYATYIETYAASS